MCGGSANAADVESDCSQPLGAGGPMMASQPLREYGGAMGGGDHKYSEDCLGREKSPKPSWSGSTGADFRPDRRTPRTLMDRDTRQIKTWFW